jgi:hypothetical protein
MNILQKTKTILLKIYGPFNAPRRKAMFVDLATFITMITGTVTMFGYFAPNETQEKIIKIANLLDTMKNSDLFVDMGDASVQALISTPYGEKHPELSIIAYPISGEVEEFKVSAFENNMKKIGEWNIGYINIGGSRTITNTITEKYQKMFICYSYEISSRKMMIIKTVENPPESRNKDTYQLVDTQKPVSFEGNETSCEASISKL